MVSEAHWRGWRAGPVAKRKDEKGKPCSQIPVCPRLPDCTRQVRTPSVIEEVAGGNALRGLWTRVLSHKTQGSLERMLSQKAEHKPLEDSRKLQFIRE